MKKCPKCKAKLQKGRRRCPECGEFVMKRRASKRGILSCLASLIEGVKSKKIVFYGIAGLLGILAVVVIVSLANGGGSSALYVKESEMAMTKGTGTKKVQLTDKLVYENSMDQFDLEYMSNHYYSKLIKKSKNGDRIFYPSSIIRLNNYTLTYRNLNEKDGEVVEVASSVTDYQISENGKIAAYTSGGVLFRYDGDEAETVGNGISTFQLSKDGKTIIYVDSERNICSYKSGKSKKLVKDVSVLEYISENCKEIYYIKDNNLYRKEIGKDAKKIASEIISVVKIYENGEAYYLKQTEKQVLLNDYVEDDTKKANSEEIKELKKSLKDSTAETHLYDLYYYNGKKGKSVAKNVQQEDVRTASERAVVLFKTCDISGMKKLKLSEISSAWEVEEKILEYISVNSKYQVAVEKKTTTITQKNIGQAILAENGDVLYFVADIAEEMINTSDAIGTLYKMSISGSKAKTPKKYASDVYAREVAIVGDTDVLYYKNVSEVDYIMQGDLYVNKKNRDENVKVGSAVCFKDADKKAVYYLSDWKYQASMGTLKRVKGNKVTEIRKAAHAFYAMEKGEVFFIGDYDVETYSGNLYRHKNGKARKIDKDVVAIMKGN